MNRRNFLTASSAALTTLSSAGWSWAKDSPKDIRITRAIGFDLVSKRCKMAGKNSRLDVHGEQATDRMVRLFTNTGQEGFGNCRAAQEAVASLLGKNPFDFFQPQEKSMKGPLGSQTMALWDLVGKIQKKPVFALLGGKGPGRVPVYDGSIYFADLLPQYADRWEARFAEEIELGLKRGHRAFKIKIGRGAKWMPLEEGFERDKAVVRLIHRHAGPDILLGVDANNGYDLARSKRFVSDLGDIPLAWLEELFPEQVDQCLELKAFIAEHHWKSLLADGETESSLDAFRPFLAAKAIDIYQGDMNRFGLEGILSEAAMAAQAGALVAPHNWGSLIGFYEMLHLGLVLPNFYRAENDPLDSEIVEAEGISIRNGLAEVSNAPGFGLKINEQKFATMIKPRFDLK